jgi:hypothetical protein
VSRSRIYIDTHAERESTVFDCKIYKGDGRVFEEME